MVSPFTCFTLEWKSQSWHFAKEQTKTPSVSQSHTGLTNGFGHALLPKSVADVSPAKEILPQIQSDQKKRDRYTSDMIHIGAPQGRLTTVQVLNLILKILQAYTFANDCRLQNADIHIDWMSSCIPSDFVKLLRVSCCMQKILQRTRTFSQRLRAAKVAKFS